MCQYFSQLQFSRAFHGQSLGCEMWPENWQCEAFQMAGSSEQRDAVNTPLLQKPAGANNAALIFMTW